MRVLFFSDLHAHNHQQFATTLPGGRNSRLQNILNVVEEITVFCSDPENEVDVVFMLGDVFHSRTKIDADVYSSTWDAFRRLSYEVSELFILVGNHDQYSKDGTKHSLSAFKAFATVIDGPWLHRVGREREFSFAAHPFTTDIAKWKEFVGLIPRCDFFLFHQGVSEAVVGAFDISVKAEIGLDDLPRKKAKFCLGGHYHKQQWLVKDSTGFIGSPLQHNFGERNDGVKGWITVDMQSGEVVHHESTAPRFFLLDMDEYNYWCSNHPHQLEENFVRVRCTAEQAEALVSCVQAEIISEPVFEEKRVDDSVIGNDQLLLETYVDQAGSELDRNRLLSLGMEMLVGGEA